MRENSATNYTTRLLAGSAYRRGVFGSLEILDGLRNDCTFKANSPEIELDVELIVYHAINSISLSLMVAFISIGLWLVQLAFHFYSLAIPGLRAIVFLINFAASIMMAYEMVYLRWMITRKNFTKKHYNKYFKPSLPYFNFFFRSISSIINSYMPRFVSDQNVITFGAFSPFTGFGTQIAQWTVAIDRKPANKEIDKSTRIQISTEEFYMAVDHEIKKLNLPNVSVLSKLFVDGFETERDDLVFSHFDSSPKARIADESIWEIEKNSIKNGFRFYRTYQYVDQGRGQVLSQFLRFYNVGSVTFVESNTFILPCIDRDRFSIIPVLTETPMQRSVRLVVFATLLLIFSFLYGVGYVSVAILYVFMVVRKVKCWRDEKENRINHHFWREEYNYGATSTFRESISAKKYESYFGTQDLIMYWKSIQEAILGGITLLLESRGIDISQFEGTAEKIINTGIIVSGGNFSATQVTTGEKASAVINSTFKNKINNEEK